MSRVSMAEQLLQVKCVGCPVDLAVVHLSKRGEKEKENDIVEKLTQFVGKKKKKDKKPFGLLFLEEPDFVLLTVVFLSKMHNKSSIICEEANI